MMQEISKPGKMTIEENVEKAVKTVMTHTKQINDKSYQSVEVKIGGNIISREEVTDMTEEEKESFKNLWKQLWVPSVSEDMILKEEQLIINQTDVVDNNVNVKKDEPKVSYEADQIPKEIVMSENKTQKNDGYIEQLDETSKFTQENELILRSASQCRTKSMLKAVFSSSHQSEQNVETNSSYLAELEVKGVVFHLVTSGNIDENHLFVKYA